MLVFAALMTAIGCSPSNGSVSGTVSFQGQNLKGGRVSFIPAQKEGAGLLAEIDESGKYTISKIPNGDYKVLVETEYLKPSPQAQMAAKTRPSNAPGAAMDPAARAKRYMRIPPIYAIQDQTPLNFKSSGGSQSFNVTLE